MTRKLLLSVVNDGIDSFGCEYTKINMHDVNFDHFDVQYKNGAVRKNLFPIVLYLFFYCNMFRFNFTLKQGRSPVSFCH